MSDQSSNRDSAGNVVDLASFRNKKSTGEELARGRKPLYVSHLNGKISGSPHMKRPESADFGDRLSRIRSSLDKINRLMSELKRMSSEPEQTEEKGKAKQQSDRRL